MNAANFLRADGERPPITMDDLTDAKFVISVMSEPVAVVFETPEELYSRLRPGRHGVLLAADGQTGRIPSCRLETGARASSVYGGSVPPNRPNRRGSH